MSDGTHKIERPVELNIPKVALWLGGLGLLPFVASAVALYLFDEPMHDMASLSLKVYGAVILSFLGGVHWGLAVARPEQPSDTQARTLIYSVIPSIVGWAALLLPTPAALLTLAVAFVIMLVFDLSRTKAGLAPAWYPKLRWPLSTGAVLSLLAGAAA